MDDRRFDAVSRVLGEQATRRGALGAVGALAGLLGVGTLETQAKKRRRRGGSGRVQAEQVEGNVCLLVCAFLPRRRRAICLRRCACIRNCFALPDPEDIETCIEGVLTTGLCPLGPPVPER
jgi:hypothetical protein